MEPLYTTQFAYTLDEYLKYNNAVLKSQKSFITVYIMFSLSSFVLGAISYYMIKNTIFSIFFALFFFIVFTIEFPVVIKKSAKKAYYSNKTLDKNISNYEFFKDELKETNLHSVNVHKYSELTKIIETKTNFYLMISNQQGYLIKNDNCSPELITFLSELKNKIH